MTYEYEQYLAHHGIKGQKWGIRRYQNEDGSLTEEGRKRYSEADTWEKDEAKTLSNEELDRRNQRMQKESQYKQNIDNRHPAKKEAISAGKKIFYGTATAAAAGFVGKNYKYFLDKLGKKKTEEAAENATEKVVKKATEEAAKGAGKKVTEEAAKNASEKLVNKTAEELRDEFRTDRLRRSVSQAAQQTFDRTGNMKKAEQAALKRADELKRGFANEDTIRGFGERAAASYSGGREAAAKVTTQQASRSKSAGKEFLYKHRRILGVGAGAATIIGANKLKKHYDEKGKQSDAVDWTYKHRKLLGVASYIAVNKIIKYAYKH